MIYSSICIYLYLELVSFNSGTAAKPVFFPRCFQFLDSITFSKLKSIVVMTLFLSLPGSLGRLIHPLDDIHVFITRRLDCLYRAQVTSLRLSSDTTISRNCRAIVKGELNP